MIQFLGDFQAFTGGVGVGVVAGAAAGEGNEETPAEEEEEEEVVEDSDGSESTIADGIEDRVEEGAEEGIEDVVAKEVRAGEDKGDGEVVLLEEGLRLGDTGAAGFALDFNS